MLSSDLILNAIPDEYLPQLFMVNKEFYEMSKSYLQLRARILNPEFTLSTYCPIAGFISLLFSRGKIALGLENVIGRRRSIFYAKLYNSTLYEYFYNLDPDLGKILDEADVLDLELAIRHNIVPMAEHLLDNRRYVNKDWLIHALDSGHLDMIETMLNLRISNSDIGSFLFELLTKPKLNIDILDTVLGLVKESLVPTIILNALSGHVHELEMASLLYMIEYYCWDSCCIFSMADSCSEITRRKILFKYAIIIKNYETLYSCSNYSIFNEVLEQLAPPIDVREMLVGHFLIDKISSNPEMCSKIITQEEFSNVIYLSESIEHCQFADIKAVFKDSLTSALVSRVLRNAIRNNNLRIVIALAEDCGYRGAELEQARLISIEKRSYPIAFYLTYILVRWNPFMFSKAIRNRRFRATLTKMCLKVPNDIDRIISFLIQDDNRRDASLIRTLSERGTSLEITSPCNYSPKSPSDMGEYVCTQSSPIEFYHVADQPMYSIEHTTTGRNRLLTINNCY